MTSTESPSIRRLIIYRMSVIAVPDGGGLTAAVKFLGDPEKMRSAWLEAEEWVNTALRAVRDAPGDNPWRHATDDAIADEIVRRSGRMRGE
jgi:hypothetical protein